MAATALLWNADDRDADVSALSPPPLYKDGLPEKGGLLEEDEDPLPLPPALPLVASGFALMALYRRRRNA